jgi:hypothetical protein
MKPEVYYIIATNVENRKGIGTPAVYILGKPYKLVETGCGGAHYHFMDESRRTWYYIFEDGGNLQYPPRLNRSFETCYKILNREQMKEYIGSRFLTKEYPDVYE